jgi:hypothetical protein
VVVQRLPPLGVPLHHRRVLDAELRGQMLDHRPRHRERILQEQADVPDRAHLQREPQLVVPGPPQRDQVPVDIVQEEEPLQPRPRRLLGELPVRLGLLVSRKLHRHDQTVASNEAGPAAFRRTPAAEWIQCANRP